MNTKINSAARAALGTDFPVSVFFSALSPEHPLMDTEQWKREGCPHVLIAYSALKVAETNSLFIWFDNVTYGNYKCLVGRFDLDTFNKLTSAPSDMGIAPVGEASFIFTKDDDERPSHVVFPQYEGGVTPRVVLWSEILPVDADALPL